MSRKLKRVYESDLPQTKKLERVISARNSELRYCKRKIIAQGKQISKLLDLLVKAKP